MKGRRCSAVNRHVSDVSMLIDIAKEREPGVPVYLRGHSAGGVVSCTYALDNQDKIAGLICESFAFQVYAPDFALAVLKGISHLAPHAHVLKLHNEDFTRDPKALKAKNEDPSGPFVFPAYAAVQVIAEGIEKAGDTDTAKVAAALRSNSFETPTGTLAFDEKGDLKDFSFVVYEWHQDGTKSEAK